MVLRKNDIIPFMYKYILMLAVLLSGCAMPAARQQSGAGAAETSAAEEANMTSVIKESLAEIQKSETEDYRVQHGDVIDISVYREQDLARSFRVSGNGTISFPMIGTVNILDKTLPEIEELLAKKLSKYLVNPQITAHIETYSTRQVFVLGEVKNPGAITLPSERVMTVLEAITLAGGFTDIASPDKTRILRLVGGKDLVVPVEISKITKEGNKSADIVLEPKDVVYVPQSFF